MCTEMAAERDGAQVRTAAVNAKALPQLHSGWPVPARQAVGLPEVPEILPSGGGGQHLSE